MLGLLFVAVTILIRNTGELTSLYIVVPFYCIRCAFLVIYVC